APAAGVAGFSPGPAAMADIDKGRLVPWPMDSQPAPPPATPTTTSTTSATFNFIRDMACNPPCARATTSCETPPATGPPPAAHTRPAPGPPPRRDRPRPPRRRAGQAGGPARRLRPPDPLHGGQGRQQRQAPPGQSLVQPLATSLQPASDGARRAAQAAGGLLL